MTRIAAGIAATFAIGQLTVCAVAAAPTPAQQFEELFGAEFRKAAASRETEDDLALAQRMLATAGQLGDAPALASEICDRVYVIGSRIPEGIGLAVEAMRLVIELDPPRAASARARIEQILRRAHARATGEQRAPMAQRLVDFLEELGDLSAAASDFGGASLLYQQAMRIADAEQGVDGSRVRSKFESTAARERIERRIEAAVQRLATDPTNRAANAELLRVYLIELDRPAMAARYARFSGDADAARLAPLAAAPVEDATTDQLIDVGQWYQALAESADDEYKEALIARGRGFFEHVRLREQSSGLQLVKAALGIARLRDAYIKLRPEEGKAIVVPAQDGSIDLLAGIEASEYVRSGRWSQSDAGLLVASDDLPARIALPAAAPRSYELSIAFTRTQGDGEVVVILPLGHATARLVLSGWGGKAGGLYSLPSDEAAAPGEPVRNPTTVAPAELSNDRQYTVTARIVQAADDKATVTVKVNGGPYLSWKGDPAMVRIADEWSLLSARSIGLGARDAAVTFHHAKLTPLQGDAIALSPPPTLVERGVVTPADARVDLLALRRGSGEHATGSWQDADPALVLTLDPRQSLSGLAVFPVAVEPGAGYALRIRFKQTMRFRRGAGGGPVLLLPVADRAVLVALGGDTDHNKAGLGLIAGEPFTQNASTVTHTPLASDRTYLLEARVEQAGDKVSIRVDLDGEKLIEWSGAPTDLSVPPGFELPEPRKPAVGAMIGMRTPDGQFTFEAAEFQALAGAAAVTRKPAAAAADDLAPIDFLKNLDADKHTLQGKWSVANNRLNNDIRALYGNASLQLPVAPEGDYIITAKFIRTLGRGVVRFYLPLGGGYGVDAVLGAEEGRAGLLATHGSTTHFRANRDARHGIGVPYEFKAVVSSKDGNTTITIDLAGKRYLEWTGQTNTLAQARSSLTGFDPAAPHVLIYNPVARSIVIFDELKLQMTRGQPRPLAK